jgi:hypothetical protein
VICCVRVLCKRDGAVRCCVRRFKRDIVLVLVVIQAEACSDMLRA